MNVTNTTDTTVTLVTQSHADFMMDPSNQAWYANERWKYFAIITSISFAFFSVASKILTSLTYPGPKNCSVVENVWRAYATSCMHACITGTLAVICFSHEKEWMEDTTQAFLVHCFSVGYFAYDTLHKLTSKEKIATLSIYVHHIMIFTVISYIQITYPVSGYGVWDYLCEITNVFLHGRKLATFSGVKKYSNVYNIFSYLFLSTFLIFRFIPQVLVSISIVFNTDITDAGSMTQFLLLFPSQMVLLLIGTEIGYKVLRNDFVNRRVNPSSKCDNSVMGKFCKPADVNANSKSDYSVMSKFCKPADVKG